MRFAPVMLALLLALSPGAVALQVSAPAASASAGSSSLLAAPVDDDTVRLSGTENTTAVMTLGTDPARTAFDSPSLALGSSLAMNRDTLGTQLRVESLDERLRATDSVEKKKQILNRFRYRIENRIISLKAKERRSTSAFSNGTISDREYLRTLGQLDAEATDVERMIEAMKAQSQDVPRSDMTTVSTTLKGKLVTIKGPVRERLGRILEGKAPPTRIYVSTTDTGIVLSTISDGTYVREVLRHDRRNPSASRGLTHIEAQNAVLEQYSWAAQNMDADGTSTYLYGSTSIYSVTVSHKHGDLIAFLDAGTEKVFKEVQYKRLFGEKSLPPGPAVANTTNRSLGGNLTLAVNRTYAGGPLRVKVTNSTGAPVQGVITVDGEVVGRTDENGVLWTLGPAEQFLVSATHDGTTVNVTTMPVNSS